MKLTDLASISYLPLHDGDGYSYGGDCILTIGDRSVSFGSGSDAELLANEIAKRWNAGRAALEQEGK